MQGYPLYTVVQRLKATKIALREWAKNGLNSLAANISKLRNKLKLIHNELGIQPLNVQLQAQEAQLQLQLSKWLSLEEDQLEAEK